MRIVIDLPLNHTSDQHDWFQQSRENPDGPYGDYYVWSDSDDKYPDIRIIFTDTEESNWAFDSVRRQFYFHRFFSHQPDLNFENPAVHEAIHEVVRFWLDLGVDGFRLDAIPYLYESEEGNGEGEPPTHEFVRRLRMLVDRDYPGRIMIAEANQWPREVAAFFGTDAEPECHMAFDFAVMPRIFYSLRSQRADELVRVLSETTDIPESAGWAVFLRNHDELTLEMVSEEYRQAMYGWYAYDPRMRANIGIRRRLAPLLDNSRRELELAHALLFALPGSPFLYYGDEIGMGDNIWLPDRDSSRTPMQWTPDRNAGFSAADPGKPYLPLVQSLVYNYTQTNVESHLVQSGSLLHWIRNVIHVRKLHPTFGLGTIRVLDTDRESVLAFTREYAGSGTNFGDQPETVLCVFSFSHNPIAFRIDDPDLAGTRLYDIFGGAVFPIFDDAGVLTLTLGAQGLGLRRIGAEIHGKGSGGCRIGATAVDFLSDEQAAGFGRFPDEVSQEDLERFCWLDDADLSVAGRRRGLHNRLGFAVQLATVRVVGRFLTDPLDVPWPVVESLAGQLGMADASVLKLYAQRGQTGYEHAAEICSVYGYVDFADPAKHEELELFRSARAWTSAEGPVRLFERAAVWLRERKVLLPGVSTLTRLVSEVRAGANDRLYAALIDAAGPSLIQELEGLLRVADGSRLTAWERLRTGPSRVSVPELLRQLDRLARLRALGAGTVDAETIPAGRMNALARYGLAGKASALQGLSGQRRGATLLCAVRALTAEVADDLCDALDAIVTERVVRKAARESATARLKSLPRLSRASLQLAKAAETLVEVLGNAEFSGADAASMLAEQISLPELRAAVDVVTELVNPAGSEGDTAAEMMRRFTTVRSFLPALASAAPFGATAGGTPTLAALTALPDVLYGRKTDPRQVDLSVLSPVWQRLINASEDIDRRAYTVAVMDAVHKALRRRDIFVLDGRRWGDPRARLLTDPAWQATKNETLRALQLPEEPAAHLDGVRQSLDTRYRAAADQMADNSAVRIGDDGKVHLSPLEAKTVPESLTQLRGLVSAMLPRVDLPDVLLEVHSWTGFLSEFSHVSEASARMDQLGVSVAAILVAEACNVGLTPVVKDGHPALTRGRLAHVDQNYVRADTLRAANSRLVQAQSALGLAQRWGAGLLASVDGMRFVVPVATVNAGANPRYFGQGRGLTWLNYLNDQVAGLGAVVVPGTVRDSLHILDGLLDLDGGQRPEMVATDTASYSDQVFGLFTLLGYRFSPRLAGLPDQRFWRIGTTTDYGQLNAVAGRNRINLDLITANWPDMLRLAGSLTAGTVRASEVLRVTQGGGTPTLLGKALAEYGRIAKTGHLLDFIDVDEGYRRQIHTQLTLQESRHALARLIFHGRRGQIRQSYREGQEDQLGALGLVLNAIILWNTRYLDAALTELRDRGAGVADEDVQRLSPLASEHINMLGRYTFTADPAGTQLRPFRNPDEDRET